MKTRSSAHARSLFILCWAVWSLEPLAPAQTPPSLSVRMDAGQARVSVTGAAATVCQIQWTDKLSAATVWYHVGYCVLSAAPSSLTDSTSLSTARYYRAVTAPSTNFVWISPGAFTMGSPDSEVGRYSDEGPQTVVTLTRGFWIGKHEVTQGEYQAVVGANPSSFPGDANLPVDTVSWYDATNYCARLTKSERLAGRLPTGYVYRLPTEAEWEYAARAGTTTRFSYGDDPGYTNLTNYAWFGANSGGKPHPGGEKQSNSWGLYDVYGDVWEWCLDLYGTYPGGSVTDPTGSNQGSNRVQRGGSWSNSGEESRSAFRTGVAPDSRNNHYGFRVVLAPEVQPPPEVVWINPGTFTMGSPASEVDRYSDEGPQTVVTLTRGFWMGKYEVTQAEYRAVMGANPSSFKGDPSLPVDTVSWNDATNYCAKLTASERLSGGLPAGWVYRLPTEAEWEYAARAGTTTRFSFGDDPGYANLTNFAWYDGNSGAKTHPVGLEQSNPWGLHDMSGNVWEWCLDWYGGYPGGSVSDPKGPKQGSDRVLRGGSWLSGGGYCRSAFRINYTPDSRYSNFGFRIVVAEETQLPANLVWIKPGTFTMGSPGNEVDRDPGEGPQTVVTLTRGFWMGSYEVTQAEYRAVMGANPSSFKGDSNLPVETVSWIDATNYCAKLTGREQAAGRLPAGYVYRLPTEAEWEYAARAGTMTRFSYGDDPGYTNLTNYAWYKSNSAGKTHPVGQKLANPWGLHDMNGSEWEWCLDWWGSYSGGIVTDPKGPDQGSYRVLRGGGWDISGWGCRSAYRGYGTPDVRNYFNGFRVLLAPGQP